MKVLAETSASALLTLPLIDFSSNLSPILNEKSLVTGILI